MNGKELIRIIEDLKHEFAVYSSLYSDYAESTHIEKKEKWPGLRLQKVKINSIIEEIERKIEKWT